MKSYSLATSRLRLPFFLIGVSGLLAVPALSAEPDRLLRAFLGVSSIPVRFHPPQDKTCCYLAIAKFNDGKFLDYAELFGTVVLSNDGPCPTPPPELQPVIANTAAVTSTRAPRRSTGAS